MPFPFSSSDPISILIVKLSAIGDVAHTIPALTALRRAFPRARIGWVVEELSAPLLQDNPDLNDLFVVRRRWRTRRFLSLWHSEIRPFVRDVRRIRWDVSLDFQGLTKSSIYAWLSRARVRLGYGDRYGRELSKIFNNHRFKPDPATEFHVVKRHLHLVRQLAPDAPLDASGTIHLSEAEREALKVKMNQAGRTDDEPLLCINPAGGWSSKLWPADFYAEAGAEIASRHHLRPMVLWGPREEPLRDAVMEGLRSRNLDPLAAPPTTIREMCSLLSLCRFYLGGDTGPSHIAGLLGIPNVTIFGASDAARNRPWPMHSGLAVQSGEFDCVPCWKRRCPLVDDENLKCLRRLEPARVIEAAERLLSGSGA